MNGRANPGADINTVVHTPVAHAEVTGDATLNRPLQTDLRMTGNRLPSSPANCSGLPPYGDDLFLFSLSNRQIAWWRCNTIQIDSLANINGIWRSEMVAAGNDMVTNAKPSANSVQGIPLTNNIGPRMDMRFGLACCYRRVAGQAGCVTPA